jgi:hypothetical protein
MRGSAPNASPTYGASSEVPPRTQAANPLLCRGGWAEYGAPAAVAPASDGEKSADEQGEEEEDEGKGREKVRVILICSGLANPAPPPLNRALACGLAFDEVHFLW